MYAWFDVVKSDKFRLNFFNFFAIRYTKVAIISLITMLIIFLLPHLNDGPFYSDLTNHLYSNCIRNGWKEFLLISNEQPVLEMCSIAWSISADFQLYVLNYFVIFLLITRPKLGYLLAFVQCCAVSAFSLLYMHHNEIPIFYSVIENYLYDPSLFEDSYLHSFFHNNVYVLGIICAFMVKTRKAFKPLRYRSVRLAIYLTTLAIPYLTLNWIYYLEQTETEPSQIVRLLLPNLSRLVIVLFPFFFVYSNLIGYSSKFLTKTLDHLKRFQFSLTLTNVFISKNQFRLFKKSALFVLVRAMVKATLQFDHHAICLLYLRTWIHSDW